MNPNHVNLNNKTKVPLRYVPKNLTIKDQKKQKKNLSQSRKLYKKGIYYTRPKVKSFKSHKSNHLANLQNKYGVENANPTQELASKTKCNLASLEKIVNKGEGAYYSSGSRPNQTARSWGLARLASTLTGGNASVIDYNILEEGCKPDSKALKLAKKQCKKVGRKCGNNKTKNVKGGSGPDDQTINALAGKVKEMRVEEPPGTASVSINPEIAESPRKAPHKDSEKLPKKSEMKSARKIPPKTSIVQSRSRREPPSMSIHELKRMIERESDGKSPSTNSNMPQGYSFSPF